MIPSPMASWSLALFLGGSALTGMLWSYQAAASHNASTARRLQRITEQATEHQRLSDALPVWARTGSETNSAEALAQRVSASIAAAGLPSTALSSLSPESIANDGGHDRSFAVRIDRRRAVLTLGSVTLPQLGRFLAAWREREPEWTVTSIDVTPINIGDGSSSPKDRSSGVQVAPGGDIPARVVLAIERWSVRQPGKVGSPSSGSAPLRQSDRSSKPANSAGGSR